MELRHYYEVLRRRVWIIALLVIVATGGVVYQVASMKPQYEAEVSMLVTPQALIPTALDNPSLAAIESTYRQGILQNVKILLQSKNILRRVAEKVGAPSAEYLLGRVKVTEIAGSDFLLINAKDDSPERAALIANTTAQQFTKYYGEINRAEATATRSFIEEQLGLARKRLEVAEQALLVYRKGTGVIALSDETSRLVQRTLDLQAAYEAATLDAQIANTRVGAIQSRLRAQNDTRLATISIATNPIVGQLRDHLTTLELELASQRQVYTDQHPKVQATLGRIAEVRQRLSTEAARVVRDESIGISPIREQLAREAMNGEVDAVVARARAKGLTQFLNSMQARLKTVPSSELGFARLQRDVRIAEQTFVRLSSLHQDALIRETKAGSSGEAAVVLVDPAQAPKVPVSQQLPLKATFAGLLGAIVGAAVAFVADSLDDRIRSSPQAEGVYGVPVLAAIPTMSSHNHRNLTTVPGTATLLLPIIFVVLMLAGGVGVGFYLTQTKATPNSIVRSGQTLMQTFNGGR